MKQKNLAMKMLKNVTAFCCVVLVASAAQAEPFDRKNSSGRQVLLRSAAIDTVAARHGFTVLETSVLPDGNLYLVQGAAGESGATLLHRMKTDPAVSDAETAFVAGLPAEVAASPLLLQASEDLNRVGTAATPCQRTYLGETWAGYADQRATHTIQLAAAHQASAGCGAGVKIAVIDTGVDGNHPLLVGAVVPGIDVFDPNGVGSDWSNLDFSVRAIVEFSVRAIVEFSVRAIVEGSTTSEAFALGGTAAVIGPDAQLALASTNLPPYFGHGTMVAGLIRLVAPGAEIVPIRVFDGNGTAHAVDIVRAIYWATDHGADVINMSFSLAETSPALRKAIQYAEARGVVMVAAAGNQGDRARVFPAAFPEVLGVAAQSNAADGSLALFSNFGPSVAEIAAPGSALITTFPGGLYAASWGTSFSAPLVSGSAALLLERPTASGQTSREIEQELKSGAASRSALAGKVLSGQLDVYRAWVLAGF